MHNLLDLITTVRERRHRDLQQASAAVAQLLESGMSLREIGSRTGIPWQTIRNWARTPPNPE
jgi:hypothetical protein